MKKFEIALLAGCLTFAGACGFTDHEIVQNTCAWNTGGVTVTCDVVCPSGKKVTGGGWGAKERGGLVESEMIRDEGRIIGDLPTGNDDTWSATWEPNPTTAGNLHVWAICANVGT